MFADLCADQVNGALKESTARKTMVANIRKILDTRDFDIVYQPIFHLSSNRPSGFEALCRFRPEPYRSPDLWFAEAESVGFGTHL